MDRNKSELLVAHLVLKHNDLLYTKGLCDCHIDKYGLEMFYTLTYSNINLQTFKRIEILVKKEPNFYNITFGKNLTLYVSFYIQKKMHYIFDNVRQCGTVFLPNSILLDAMSFQQKSPTTFAGGRGSFVFTFLILVTFVFEFQNIYVLLLDRHIVHISYAKASI